MATLSALPGDLLYCRSQSLVGMTIRFAEERQYSGWVKAIWRSWRRLIGRIPLMPAGPDHVTWGNHIVLVTGDSIIQALAKGLVTTPIAESPYDDSNSVILRLSSVCPGVTDLQRKAVCDFGRWEAAHKDSYAFTEIASITVNEMTPLKLNISYGRAMICSTFGARAWEHAGVIIPTVNTGTTLPSDLFKMTIPNSLG